MTEHLRMRTTATLVCVVAAVGLTMAQAVRTDLPAAGAGPLAFGYVVDDMGNGVIPFVPHAGTPPYTADTEIPAPSSGDPSAIAISPDGSTAYVAEGGTSTVTPLNTATDTFGSAIAVGSFPDAIAVSPDGSTVYVANFPDGTVSVINRATNKVTATITVGNQPVAVAVTPNGSAVWVGSQNAGGTSSISVINTATETVSSTFYPFCVPTGIAMAPGGSTAYVSCNDIDSLQAINTASHSITSIPVGTPTETVAVSPGGSTAYVAYFNSVIPVDLLTDTAGTAISVGSDLNAVAVEPGGGTVWAADGSGAVYFINTTTDAVSSVSAGSQLLGVALEPDQAPQAALSVTPAPVGSPTSFNASASTSSSSPIVSYHWIFGDGTSATTATPTTTHTYGSGGTITASVTETDSAGTSTTQVFTGQTMSRNGGPQAVATATFVITSCATGTTSCKANVTSKTQSVSVNGVKSAAKKATIALSVSPQSLKVPGYPAIAPTATLIDKGLTGSVDVTNTVHKLPSVAGIKIIYQPVGASPPPATILKRCSTVLPPDPCYFSITESGGSITASLRFPAGDPKWRLASKVPTIASFSPTSGPPGKVVTITGTNLSEVTSVTFGKVAAKIDARATTTLKATVPTGVRTGPITVKSLAGMVISTKAFTVT